MIVGLGIDAVRIHRVEELIGRFGERFTRRVFTPAEREECEKRPRPFPAFATRFAAKEAVMKALGCGWGQGVRFREIEVIKGEEGKPRVELRGGAKAQAEKMGVSYFHLSLSHEGDLAVAQVVAEKR